VLVVAPFVRDVLSLEPLSRAHWLLVVGIALAYFVVIELDKALHRRHVAATAT
jgi:hypothetical protein